MRLLAALLVLVPCSALSQSPEPPSPSPQVEPVVAAPAPAAVAPIAAAAPVAPAQATVVAVSPAAAPQWSIGAGILLNPSFLLDGVGVGIFVVQSPPGASASLERRLSDRNWLVFDLTGGLARYRQERGPGEYGTTKEDSRRLGVSAGLRRRVTPSAAPVDVSFLALADVGLRSADIREQTFSGTEEERTTRAWSAGATLGIAVERELVEGLSLRVATPLAGLTWHWSRTEIEAAPAQDGNGVALSVALAPRIELRMAF